MLRVHKTPTFDDWYESLRDHRARVRIHARIERLTVGHFGDSRPLGGGLFEMRVDLGPGYRVYFKWFPESSVVLLLGGDKATQGRDVERARNLARRLEEGC
jgi:putative addiction module killer protein